MAKPGPTYPLRNESARHDVLLVDLYELTMMAAYHSHGMNETATFELFVRRLPENRNYLLAAGLEQALDYLEGLSFSEQDIARLADTGRFRQDFLDWLRGLRFTGEVHAVPEGTVIFAHEPLLRVTAPLAQAQLVETRLLNLLHFQTLIASKAARMVSAAAGRPLIDFGLRRAHGEEAGLFAARAAYLAGFSGTSNVLAAALFAIPVFGTMAHAFVQAHDDEALAFERFASLYPDHTTLLIDTYDTEQGAHKVAALAPRLFARGVQIGGVRIDSGDLGWHAREVRRILDAAGLRQLKIMASSGLEERQIAELVASGSPIDSFAPGTHLVTSADAPFLDCAFKLVEYAGQPRFKRSEGKVLWPGVKQVWREYSEQGQIARDRLLLADEPGEGQALLAPVMRGGKRLLPRADLASNRAHATAQLRSLPEPLHRLDHASAPALEISAGVRSLLESLQKRAERA